MSIGEIYDVEVVDNYGYVDGDICRRNGCLGIILNFDYLKCYCNVTPMPPCAVCETGGHVYCSDCDWECINGEESLPEPKKWFEHEDQQGTLAKMLRARKKKG